MGRPSQIDTAEGSDRAEIRRRYSDPWEMFMVLNRARFLLEVPSARERQAFALEFPLEFLDLWNFREHETDQWPASIHHGELFRRPGEFWDSHSAAGFDPPDLGGLRGVAEYKAVAAARGRFWIEKNWPLTNAERAWLGAHAEPGEASTPATVVQMPAPAAGKETDE